MERPSLRRSLSRKIKVSGNPRRNDAGIISSFLYNIIGVYSCFKMNGFRILKKKWSRIINHLITDTKRDREKDIFAIDSAFWSLVLFFFSKLFEKINFPCRFRFTNSSPASTSHYHFCFLLLFYIKHYFLQSFAKFVAIGDGKSIPVAICEKICRHCYLKICDLTTML